MAIINGRCYDWNSVTLGISGCENVEPTEISYDAERDARQILERIDQGACGSTQQRAGLAGDHGAVAQLNGSCRRAAGGLAAGMSLLFHSTAAHIQARLIHQQFQLVALALMHSAGDLLRAQALVVPAHDLCKVPVHPVPSRYPSYRLCSSHAKFLHHRSGYTLRQLSGNSLHP